MHSTQHEKRGDFRAGFAEASIFMTVNMKNMKMRLTLAREIFLIVLALSDVIEERLTECLLQPPVRHLTRHRS